MRFEPGETKTVKLVNIGGAGIVRGGNALTDGPTTPADLPAAMERVRAGGFEDVSAG